MGGLSEMQVDDLRDRLRKARLELEHIRESRVFRSDENHLRLGGKAEGVGLAISYLDEYRRGLLAPEEVTPPSGIAHRVMEFRESEIVCTCGEYFRNNMDVPIGTLTLGVKSALAYWAEHFRKMHLG